jgi:hypothetical protein
MELNNRQVAAGHFHIVGRMYEHNADPRKKDRTEEHTFSLRSTWLCGAGFVNFSGIRVLVPAMILMLLGADCVLAQPGGGGGLSIGGFYSDKLHKIDLLNDPFIKIRTFVLKGDTVCEETFLHERFVERSRAVEPGQESPMFVLPHSDPASQGTWIDKTRQRIYVEYGTTVMILDLTGVMRPNGSGDHHEIDSVVVQNGHFRFRLTAENSWLFADKRIRRDTNLVKKGITLYSAGILSQRGLLEISPKTDLSFLKDKNLPASYFLKRARYHLQNDRTGPAFADIQRGVEKNNGIVNCEATYLLCDAFAKKGQYQKAVEHIPLGTGCKRYRRLDDKESAALDYRTRIDLYIKLHRYDLVLQDYDSLIALSAGDIYPIIYKAEFRMDYLKDYAGAVRDLTGKLEAMQEGYSGQHSQIYFSLATAEYLNGDKRSAFEHWLRAIESGYGHSRDEDAVVHFDSLITRHPRVPELYLARAISNCNRGSYIRRGAEAKKCFDSALRDLDKVAELGLKDGRIDRYREAVTKGLNESL